MNFWEIVSIFGDVQFWVGASIVSIFFLFTIPKRARKHITWFVFQVLPAVVMSWAITQSLKIIFKIPRPCFGLLDCPISYSFPSGHATVIFAAVTVLSLHYKKRLFMILLFIFAGLVALSRLMLNVHRIEDIILGSIIGLVTGFLVQKAYTNHQREVRKLVSEVK